MRNEHWIGADMTCVKKKSHSYDVISTPICEHKHCMYAFVYMHFSFCNWMQKNAAICMRQQRACVCSKKRRERTEATTPSPNNRSFYFALIKDEVLKPREEELTRWREVSSWRNRRPGPGRRCERGRARLRGYLQAVRNRKQWGD